MVEVGFDEAKERRRVPPISFAGLPRRRLSFRGELVPIVQSAHRTYILARGKGPPLMPFGACCHAANRLVHR